MNATGRSSTDASSESSAIRSGEARSALDEVNDPLVIKGAPNNVSDAVAILGTLSPARNRLRNDVVT